MSAIGHSVTKVTTQQTTSSATYVDVSGASIASGNFTTGDDYLIWINAQIRINSGAAGIPFVRVTQTGGGAFAGSENANKRPLVNSMTSYTWFHKWTAVSGEGIKLQFRTSNTNDACVLDQICLVAIHLTELATSDWAFAYTTTDLALSASFQDGASVTFTPVNNNDDWLVLTTARWDVATTTVEWGSRISESMGATILPQFRRNGANASAFHVETCARVFTLSNASHTIKEQSAAISGTPTASDLRTDSTVFCLRLNAFNQHQNAYTEAKLDLGTTDYGTQLQTLSVTPSVAGDWLVYSSWASVDNATAITNKGRQQIDNADDPATVTSDLYTQNQQATTTEEVPMQYLTLANLTAAAHTIDVDGSVGTATSGRGGQQRVAVAFSMELASVGGVTQTESAVLTDTALVNAITTASDSATATEGIPATGRVSSDSASLTDTVATVAPVSQSETATLTEARSATLTVSQAESATLTDALATIPVLLTQSESVTATDMLTALSAAVANADTGTLTESSSTTLTPTGGGNEDVNSTEDLAVSEAVRALLASLSTDSATLTDSPVPSFTPTAADTGTLTETPLGGLDRADSESLTVSDAAVATLAGADAEAAAMAEAITALLASVRVSETETLTESANTLGQLRGYGIGVAVLEPMAAGTGAVS